MRLIDGDALRERLQSLAYDDWSQGVSTSWADAYREIADMVEEQPEQDVVRCRDCGHSYEDLGGRVCAYGVCVDCAVSDDFYCALAERRE